MNEMWTEKVKHLTLTLEEARASLSDNQDVIKRRDELLLMV